MVQHADIDHTGLTGVGGGANAHNENDAAALVGATSAGDAGSRHDHFPGTSLDAKWVAEANALSAGPTVKYSSVFMRQSASATPHNRMQAFTPSGAFRVEAKIRMGLGTSAGGGLSVRDSGSTDSGGDQMLIHCNATSNAFEAYSVDSGSSTLRGSSPGEFTVAQLHSGVYVAIERNGSNAWTLQVSPDRAGWLTLVSGHSKTFTVAKVGFRIYGPAVMWVDFFDVVS